MSDQPEPETVEEPPATVEEQLAFDVADFPGGIHGAVEAVLMVVDEPVTTMALASVLEQPVSDVEAALAELEAGYAEQHRGFTLRQVGGGWRMPTPPSSSWPASSRSSSCSASRRSGSSRPRPSASSPCGGPAPRTAPSRSTTSSTNRRRPTPPLHLRP